jgi:hypothetical protein
LAYFAPSKPRPAAPGLDSIWPAVRLALGPIDLIEGISSKEGQVLA